MKNKIGTIKTHKSIKKAIEHTKNELERLHIQNTPKR